MQFLVSFKVTTTVSHWVNVGIGSDEVSPESHLWFARNVELQSRAKDMSEFWRASNPRTGGRRPKNRFSGIPLPGSEWFFNLTVASTSHRRRSVARRVVVHNDGLLEVESRRSSPLRRTEDEYDFVAPVEICFAVAFVGRLVPLLFPVFAGVRRVFLLGLSRSAALHLVVSCRFTGVPPFSCKVRCTGSSGVILARGPRTT